MLCVLRTSQRSTSRAQVTTRTALPAPGGRSAERASQFACGKQFIGQQIVKLINMPMAGAESSEQGEQG